MEEKIISCCFSAHSMIKGNHDNQHRFTAKDMCHMHKTWLATIYSRVGNYMQGFHPLISELSNEKNHDSTNNPNPCLFNYS
jgi:hypothetical protein